MGLSASVLGPAERVLALSEHDPKRKVWNTAPRSKLKTWNAIGSLACLSILSFELMATCDHLKEQMSLKKEQIWSRVQSSKKLHLWQFSFFLFFAITTWNSTFLNYTWKKMKQKRYNLSMCFHYLLPYWLSSSSTLQVNRAPLNIEAAISNVLARQHQTRIHLNPWKILAF
jgi:hypothetical protein